YPRANAGRWASRPSAALESTLSWPIFSPRRLGAAGAPAGGIGKASELTMGYRVAVVGATGNVGREMLAVLAERSFPADEVVALASRRSQGSEVSFGESTLKAKAL